MSLLEKIMQMLDERIEMLYDQVKGHGTSLNTKGAAYDIGALDEARYIKDEIIDIYKGIER